MFGLSKDIELCLKGQDIEFIGCILINHVNSFLIENDAENEHLPITIFFLHQTNNGSPVSVAYYYFIGEFRH